MKCPKCGSERVLVLVHSLRALCGACMHQWTSEADYIDLLDIAESAAALFRDRRPRPEPPEAPDGSSRKDPD